MAGTIQDFKFTTSGGAQSFTPNTDLVLIYPETSLLTGNVSVSVASAPVLGDNVTCILTLVGLSLNGFTLDVFGLSYTQEMIDASNGDLFVLTGSGVAPTSFTATYIPNFGQTNFMSGSVLADGTVSLQKLVDLTSAQIIVGNGSNVPTAVAVTGDIGITNAGVTSITAGAIVNADVNASAAIARTKLASGTASHVVINDGSGVFSSEAQLAASRGGTGQDTSASTGFATVSAGTWSVGSISDVITLDVSFESGEVGDFKVKLPYACTVTEIYAYAYKAIAGTDNGTIVPKDNGGTTMTGGTITFTASDARGTAYTSTPSSNNAFSAGQLLTLTTAKTTAGGKALVSVKVTRNL